MAVSEKMLDLTGEASSQLQSAAYHELKDLVRGEIVTMLTKQEPTMLMNTINLHLRDNLSWEIQQEAVDLWRVVIRHREDAPATDVIDLLTRDHKRLDDLFARSLHHINAGEVAEAAPLIKEFIVGLKKHMDVENNILTLSFAAPRDPFGGDPTSTMLREHDEILGQAAVIESYFEDGLPDAKEVAAFFAIMSGTLAKHEYREESLLFPHWKAAIFRVPAEMQSALFKRVQETLIEGSN
ncbi:hemerythrin domain-containing protein [Sulfurirhabdus autotrophica]|uniref:Hemerythrin-like domain-containing protein n=1 Tax=Sulfurirhabdus autotrophica TaxID=1706046 RepID=A0A4R3YFG3_9PROT|nr:hemerythrin domain-containing protein [Sulfurirhabdus autotrophica]TCV90850.1 hypothetical protein EDC63_101825 [Sulfurirhabdus autotrophica]